MSTQPKKLIEVALPLEAINAASAREKSIRHGHPSTLHLWWSRKPLATARAVIFAQMVDDPSAHPDLFPSDEAQEKERQRLFRIIEELVRWENTANESVLQQARDEIWRCWRYTCAENADHPQAKELFNPDKLPAFHDPFAGGGSIPLEALRLGLDAYASDLNPVAVLINKAMIEIPPKFTDHPPVNPEAHQEQRLLTQNWRGLQGLVEDLRYYGMWMREEAEKRIGHLYPRIEITLEMAKDRPDLMRYVGQKLTVIAWLWARTVKSPNPAFAQVDVPLTSTFMLSAMPGKEAYVEPVIEGSSYRLTVRIGRPKNAEIVEKGTRLARANFICLISKTPISGDYIKAEGKAGRMGTRLLAVVAEGEHGRVYLPPTEAMETIACQAKPKWLPEGTLVEDARAFTPILYGLTKWCDLYTDHQLVTLTTFSDLVGEVRERVKSDALVAGLAADGRSFVSGGSGATAYADAVGVYLAFAVSKETIFLVSQARWRPGENKSAPAFGRQAIAMVWNYADLNPFAGAGGDFSGIVDAFCKTLENGPSTGNGRAEQSNAMTQTLSVAKVISTDPPYYDNIPYADLSDYFYVWLRHSLRTVFPDLFATLAVPKAEELAALPYRHNGRAAADAFFLEGMTQAMHRLAEQAHPAFPVTIYYAFKQSESDSEGGTASTGWETFLDAVHRAGFTTTGTWPIRTEGVGRLRAMESNALASSIVL